MAQTGQPMQQYTNQGYVQGAPPAYGQPVQPQYGNQVPPGTRQYQQYGGQQQQQLVYTTQPAGVVQGPPQPGVYPPGPPQPAPLMQQPAPGGARNFQWMTAPAAGNGCPPGLEYLTQIDQLLVKQELELIEILTGWEQANKYRVFNSVNQQVYFAAEESDMCMRQCCGPSRAFTIHITDNNGREVLRINRDFKCCAGCCWCAACDACAFEVKVDLPTTGEVLGYVRQEFSCCQPKITVRDHNQDVQGIIEGPCCQCACCGDIEFPMYSPSGPVIGKIAKQWTGFFKEAFTDADNFSITFPMDMDVRLKATMMGALFLVDFMFFENNQNNNHHH